MTTFWFYISIFLTSKFVIHTFYGTSCRYDVLSSADYGIFRLLNKTNNACLQDDKPYGIIDSKKS